MAIGTSSRELWYVDSGPGVVGPGDTRPGVGYLKPSLGFPFGLGKTKPLSFLQFSKDGVSTTKGRGL